MKIVKMRKECGMTQADVAQYLGISIPTYLNKEKQRASFTIKEKGLLNTLFDHSRKPSTTRIADEISTKELQLRDGLYEVITITLYRKIHQ